MTRHAQYGLCVVLACMPRCRITYVAADMAALASFSALEAMEHEEVYGGAAATFYVKSRDVIILQVVPPPTVHSTSQDGESTAEDL